MNSHYLNIHNVLAEITQSLQSLSLWSDLPPSNKALSSSTPFCCDTMPFEQWLQWVFLPKLQSIIDGNHELPTASGIAPAAEEMLNGYSEDTATLICLIKRFDQLISNL